MDLKCTAISSFSLLVKEIKYVKKIIPSGNSDEIIINDTNLGGTSTKEIYTKLTRVYTNTYYDECQILYVLPEVYEEFIKTKELTIETFKEFSEYTINKQAEEITVRETIEGLPSNTMLTPMTWDEFANAGLILIVNQILHIFGIALVRSYDKDGKFIGVTPNRTKFRGFSEKSTANAYKQIAKFMSLNHEQILKDAEEN